MDGRAFLRRHPAIDGHADTLQRVLAEPAVFFAESGGGHLDSRRLRSAGQRVQVMAVYTPPEHTDLAALQYMLDMVHAFYAILDSSLNAALDPPWRPVLDRASLDAACAPGAHGLALFVEGASPLRRSLANLDIAFRLGVRGLTITHNRDNEAARGCFAEGGGRGLTAFGRDLVQAMQQLGMVVDLAHGNDQTIEDALSLARRPVIDSHTGLRSMLAGTHPRLQARALSDDLARGIAATGGVVCIDYLADHLVARGDPPRAVTLEDVADVVAHAVEVAGIDHVGLGSDWDGFGGADTVQGLEDCSRLPALIESLAADGFTDGELAKIAGGNLRRAISKALPA